jgi:hypothetical protein
MLKSPLGAGPRGRLEVPSGFFRGGALRCSERGFLLLLVLLVVVDAFAG